MVKLETIRSFIIVIVCLLDDLLVNKHEQLHTEDFWPEENASHNWMSSEFCDNHTTHVQQTNRIRIVAKWWRHFHLYKNVFEWKGRKC